MGELIEQIGNIETFKTGFIMLVMTLAIGWLAKVLLSEQKDHKDDMQKNADRLEKAGEKFMGLSEKMVENQIEEIKAKNELAKSMTAQAEATKALGKIVEAGFSDITTKLKDTKDQIVAHIDIKKQQLNSNNDDA